MIMNEALGKWDVHNDGVDLIFVADWKGEPSENELLDFLKKIECTGIEEAWISRHSTSDYPGLPIRKGEKEWEVGIWQDTPRRIGRAVSLTMTKKDAERACSSARKWAVESGCHRWATLLLSRGKLQNGVEAKVSDTFEKVVDRLTFGAREGDWFGTPCHEVRKNVECLVNGLLDENNEKPWSSLRTVVEAIMTMRIGVNDEKIRETLSRALKMDWAKNIPRGWDEGLKSYCETRTLDNMFYMKLNTAEVTALDEAWIFQKENGKAVKSKNKKMI